MPPTTTTTTTVTTTTIDNCPIGFTTVCGVSRTSKCQEGLYKMCPETEDKKELEGKLNVKRDLDLIYSAWNSL